MSFIQARDPSILARNVTNFQKNLCTSFIASETSKEEEKPCQLPVFLRIKPAEQSNDLYKTHNNNKILLCDVPPDSHYYKNVRNSSTVRKKYSFSKIYTPNVTQTDLFDDCVKEKVLDFINGKNSTIFAYGTSGSGKTYTILGTDEQPGIVPRVLEYLFRTLPPIDESPRMELTASGDINPLNDTARKNVLQLRNSILNTNDKSTHIRTYKAMQNCISRESVASLVGPADVSLSVWISFVEVYNEYMYDLLKSPSRSSSSSSMNSMREKQRPKLQLGQDKNGNTYIKSLTSVNVSSGLEAYQILQYGMQNLNYAATNINNHSSRSHCIFTIKLVQANESVSQVQLSQFNLCDLAGSERIKHTGNVGVRLKESNNINTSLHVLGRCIQTLRETQTNSSRVVVPFRESKLTRLFQRALIGNEYIAMIVNINAERETFDETQHVLHFSAIAKDILIEPKVEEVIKLKERKRFSQYLEQKREHVLLSSIHEEVEQSASKTNDLTLEEQKKAQVRAQVVEVYANQMENMRVNYEKRLKCREIIAQTYKEKIDDLEDILNQYEENNRKRRKVSVIDLTDDDERDNLKAELNGRNEEVRLLKLELEEKNDRIVELESVLTDAEMQYREIEDENETQRKQLEENTRQILNLMKENEILRMQSSAHALEQANLAEHIEQLEKIGC